MKEKKYYLTEEQIRFLEKMIWRIEEGWDLYSFNTIAGLDDILDMGYYKDNQRGWLQNMRLDYIGTYCNRRTI